MLERCLSYVANVRSVLTAIDPVQGAGALKELVRDHVRRFCMMAGFFRRVFETFSITKAEKVGFEVPLDPAASSNTQHEIYEGEGEGQTA
jgi:hypothetical protein